MSAIIAPEVVQEREKREYNERQAERRRIALAILPQFVEPVTAAHDVDEALRVADLLIAKTEYRK